MNDSKVLFVKKFLAILFNEKVETIPINNEKFKNGIEKMSEYFEAHKAKSGPYADKIELLFLNTQ